MCNPAIFVAASMAITAAAGAYQADSQKKSGEYQNEVAQQNAELDDFRAEQSSALGSIAEEKHRSKVRQMAGTQRANLAANGIDLSSGTAEDMVAETYQMGETDALTIRFNALNEAWGYRVSGTNNRNDGAFAKATGKNNATGTYLSTAASVAGQASAAYSNGTFKKAKPATAAPSGGYAGTGPN